MFAFQNAHLAPSDNANLDVGFDTKLAQRSGSMLTTMLDGVVVEEEGTRFERVRCLVC